MGYEARRTLWKARVEQWQQSGLSQAAFARQQDMDIKRLRYWASRLSKDDPATRLVPIKIKNKASPKSAPTPALSLTSPSGWTLTLPTGVEAAWLGNLLQSL